MSKLFFFVVLALVAFQFADLSTVETTETNRVETAELVEMENLKLQSGLYVADIEKKGPTFHIDTENLEWMTTAHVATSYAIGGSIFATTEGFLAATEDETIEILFEVNKDDQFTILRVKNKRRDLNFWLKEGMVFKPVYFE